jgi:threonine/homoserine/homoserine lactone efflux protein
MNLVSGPVLATFLLASVVLAATPGPGVAYIVARTLAQGRRAGLTSVAGVALGNLGNALGASMGLAALFAVSSAAFTVVKLVGAAYLVYLGIAALRRPTASAPATPLREPKPGRIFREGFIVALLNPKTALFFAAFLPQFIHAGASAALQSAALGTIFVLVAATTDSAYVLAADLAASSVAGTRRSGTIARWVTAATFIALGIFTAASGSRTAR